MLKDYTVRPRAGDADLFAVFPSGLSRSRKVRVFVDFLVELFREHESALSANVLNGLALRSS